MCPRTVAGPARTEVDPHPDPILFIGKKIDVMIPPADRPKLLGGERFQVAQ